ncbi:hypothetical protein FACS1894132_00170 [Clostridia bacterium]|nr:hypothetical protein FACS1894132_00170 [Clostridia bacterium]
MQTNKNKDRGNKLKNAQKGVDGKRTIKLNYFAEYKPKLPATFNYPILVAIAHAKASKVAN